MKLIILNGPSCSGKSTIAKIILEKKDRSFYLSYDALKWSFSKYKFDVHGPDVRAVLLSIARTVLDLEYDVITDSALYQDWREQLITLAKEKKYQIVEINFEAEYPVLEERFNERVASATANSSSRISNTSLERFRELCKIYEKEKNPDAVTFQTDKQTIEEIVVKIRELL